MLFGNHLSTATQCQPTSPGQASGNAIHTDRTSNRRDGIAPIGGVLRQVRFLVIQVYCNLIWPQSVLQGVGGSEFIKFSDNSLSNSAPGFGGGGVGPTAALQ